jgi:hypothetical protein
MLDITAFSNALRDGTVSFLTPLDLRPFLDADERIVSVNGEDAIVFPLARDGDRPQFALRLPLDAGAGSRWPARYAELASIGGAIQAHLPDGLTILDVDDVPGIDVALLYAWVPGETLTTRVTRARERVARDRLTDLLWPLADLAEALRMSGMAHGDIAPGNLIVRPDGGIVLVDLDRMGYHDASALPEPRRRAGYRLPRGGGAPAEEDAFALLVLMASCGILADASVPIDHERAHAWSHPTLLFSTWDLMDPQRSRLVREVEEQLSTLSRGLLDLLIAACNGHPDRLSGIVREATRHIRRHGQKPEGDETAFMHPPEWRVVPSRARAAPPAVPEDDWRAEVAPAPTERPVPGGWRVEPEPEPASPPAEVTWPEPVSDPDATRAAAAEVAMQWHTVPELLEAIRSVSAPPDATGAGERRQRRAARRRQDVAERLRRALAANDRAVLVDLAMSGALAELGDSRREDVVQVVRALAHDTLNRAVASDDDERIVAAVDESVFAQDTDLDPAFRDRVRLARDRERWAGRMLAAVREADGRVCATLLVDAPPGGVDRLPPSIRGQARRLADQHEAISDAQEAIRARDAGRLAQALGRLVAVRPTWSDHVDPAAVVALLGEDQIERRLMARFAAGKLAAEEQWMVDIVIAAGRLPEVTRLAGVAPKDVDGLIHRRV